MDVAEMLRYDHERDDKESENHHARTVHRERNVLRFVEIARNLPGSVAVIGAHGDQDVVVEMGEEETIVRSAANEVNFSGGNVYELLRRKIMIDQNAEQKDLKQN